jgi:hypothetical protein
MDLARKNPTGFQKDAETELVGRNLITSYNNKSYKVVQCFAADVGAHQAGNACSRG